MALVLSVEVRSDIGASLRFIIGTVHRAGPRFKAIGEFGEFWWVR
jgi:hypothetical protein